MSKVSPDTLLVVLFNLCYRCDALSTDLDSPGNHHHSHEKTNFLIKSFDPGILWDDFGIRHDIVVCVSPHMIHHLLIPFYQPFTHVFPWADIHELLAPDLLHQLIKGVFKDHLVTWVADYLYITHDKTAALEIIEDIDHQYVYSSGNYVGAF